MIAITGGGTGGHIFPILAVVDELRSRGYDEFLWIGQKGGKEEAWAERYNLRFIGIPAGKMRRYFSLKNITDLFKIFMGFLKSLIVIKKSEIALLFSKGGFVTVPPVIASWLKGVPVVTHESDITPGLANRINARFSQIVFVSFEETKNYFKDKVVKVTGNPIRNVIKNGNIKKGRAFLGIKGRIPVVLILGGSLGAASINRAVWEMIEKYPLDFYLVHQCGPGNKNDKITSKIPDRYVQLEFINKEMGDILKAADLIVSRAGAGAIYEIGYIGKPAIFIPLPLLGSRGEQIKNARYLRKKNAAVVLEDKNLNGDVLYKKISAVLADANLMYEMSTNIKSLIIEDAEKKIVDEFEKLIG